jgi:uncharacterized protein
MAGTTLLGLNERALTDFVGPYYSKKDAMHDMSHIRGFLRVALSISRKYPADKEILTYAAYFHGIDVRRYADDLLNFLASQGLPKRKTVRILRVASESHKESKPKTVEGKILHDAHLVVGGKTLMVARFLVTGALKGYPVGHTINYFEESVDGRFRCYLPETRKRYLEMEKFARRFFQDLKKSISEGNIQEGKVGTRRE